MKSVLLRGMHDYLGVLGHRELMTIIEQSCVILCSPTIRLVSMKFLRRLLGGS